MRTRIELHEILCDILCSPNCYYRPPSTIRMSYPCIVYDDDGTDITHADNLRYLRKKRYAATVIDECAESEIANRLLNDERLKYLRPEKGFSVDGLNHFPFTLYY